MVFRFLLLFFGSVLLLFSSQTGPNRYVLGTLNEGSSSVQQYFDNIGIANVYVSSVCRDNCSGSGCCYPVIKNNQGQVLQRYGSQTHVSTIANGRYKSGAYLLYLYSYGSGDSYHSEHFLINQKGEHFNVPSYKSDNVLASIIDENRALFQVADDGLYRNGVRIAKSEALEQAVLQNNPQGDIAIVAINTNRVVLASDSVNWKNAGIVLAQHSDVKGILAAYPQTNKRYYISVYNRINLYNKGLMGAVIDFKDDSVSAGWLLNTSDENIGFDPELYLVEDSVVVSVYNSSTRQSNSLRLTQEEFASVGTTLPEHTIGFESEEFLGFVAGARLSQLSWIASSKVEPKSVNYGEVTYDIGDALYKTLYFEGKVGNINLALSYLRGEAQEKGGLTASASEALNFVVDFNQLFSPSSSLRVSFEDATINGVATFHTDFNSLSITPDGTQEAFSSKLTRFNVLNMLERGWFFGGAYTQYKTPSAVGFSNSSKNIEVVALDKEFEIESYEFVFGYDEISYASRYETDMSRFYVQAMGGIGASVFSLSSQTRQAVEARSGKSVENSTYSIALEGSVDVGYIYQQRFKAARGLGYSLSGGYHVRGSLNGMGQSENSDKTVDVDALVLEMSRYDVWHGPYVSFNVIY